MQISGKGGDFIDFYMLNQRGGQHATPIELEAVRMACVAVLETHEEGKGKNAGPAAAPAAAGEGGGAAEGPVDAASLRLLPLVSQALKKYRAALLKKLRRVEGETSKAGGPSPQRLCWDKHPQCQLWADKASSHPVRLVGTHAYRQAHHPPTAFPIPNPILDASSTPIVQGECEANPRYMVGDESTGHCRLACRVCTPPSEPMPEWGIDEEVLLGMKAVAADLLLVLQSKACHKSPHCPWVSAGSGSDLHALER